MIQKFFQNATARHSFAAGFLFFVLFFNSFSFASNQKLALNLAQFKHEALKEIYQIFPKAKILKDGGIWFQEGAAAITVPSIFPASDFSAVYYLVRLSKNVHPDSAGWIAYTAGLNGEKNIYFINGSTPHRMRTIRKMNSMFATFKAATPKARIEQVIVHLKNKFPTAKIVSYSFIQAIQFEISDLTQSETFIKLYKTVNLIPEVIKTYHNGYVFPDMSWFEEPVFLGKAPSERNKTDLIKLRPALNDFISKGVCFKTPPSLPKPFGEGPKLDPKCGGRGADGG